jgi:uncharacterized DUF497 family protein
MLGFAWDDTKNRSNLAKHGISFETASKVFDDPYALSLPERVAKGEQRWITVGWAVGVPVILPVAHTVTEDGEEVIRIISARKATASERRGYEERIQ